MVIRRGIVMNSARAFIGCSFLVLDLAVTPIVDKIEPPHAARDGLRGGNNRRF